MNWINERDDYPELLQDLADKLAAMLSGKGMEAKQATELGMEAAEYLRQEWGGQQIYVPKGEKFEYTKQHIEIFEEWKLDAEPVELSRKYNLSVQAVYGIIGRMRARQHAAQQPSLFDNVKET